MNFDPLLSKDPTHVVVVTVVVVVSIVKMRHDTQQRKTIPAFQSPYELSPNA